MARTRRKTVGARELKTRLGQYIADVRSGATIVVTERGVAVAELRPIYAPTDRESRLRAMEEAGLITRGSGQPLPPTRPARIRGVPASRTLLEDREDRF